MYKFNGKRYMTKGINEEVPLHIQILIWEAIDDLINSDTKADYLQVFSVETFLKDNVTFLKIKHTQEQPSYSKEYVMEHFNQDIKLKVFVIDDTTHVTMLLSNEY